MPVRNRGFRLYRGGGPAYLQSPLLSAGGMVDHAFSTRLGGLSSGKLAFLNTAYHAGDNTETVLENRKRFFGMFGYDSSETVSVSQVHGTGIALFCGVDRGEGARPDRASREADALIAVEEGLALAAYAADCQLLYVVSLQRPLVALVHSGRSGALLGIGPRLVSFLRERFEVDPGRLLVGGSPCVCKNCYRVDERTAAQFREAGWGGTPFMETHPSGKIGLDLQEVNFAQLSAAGVKAENMARSGWCTSCRPDLFYSYRRDRGVTGRMIGFIALRSKGACLGHEEE